MHKSSLLIVLLLTLKLAHGVIPITNESICPKKNLSALLARTISRGISQREKKILPNLEKISKILKESPELANKPYFMSPLRRAIFKSKNPLAIARILIQNGANVNETYKSKSLIKEVTETARKNLNNEELKETYLSIARTLKQCGAIESKSNFIKRLSIDGKLQYNTGKAFVIAGTFGAVVNWSTLKLLK